MNYKAGFQYVGVGVGVLIYNEKQEVFCAKRGEGAKNEQGTWEFPGGTVEYGETIEYALKREVLEEYGMYITNVKQVGAFDHILKEEGQHWVSIFFIAEYTKGEPKILEPTKCSDIGWFDIDNLPIPLSYISEISLKYCLDNNELKPINKT